MKTRKFYALHSNGGDTCRSATAEEFVAAVQKEYEEKKLTGLSKHTK